MRKFDDLLSALGTAEFFRRDLSLAQRCIEVIAERQSRSDFVTPHWHRIALGA